VFFISLDPPNLSHSCLIWTASSRVGAKTRTIGPSPSDKYGYHVVKNMGYGSGVVHEEIAGKWNFADF
jgi:hypothetical protein